MTPRYLGPDVTARFDTIALAQEGPDRVRVRGVRGEPPPPTAKVAVNVLGGYRNSMTFVLTGLEIAEKADLVRRTLLPRLEGLDVDVRLTPHGDHDAHLRLVVRGDDEARVGRAFTAAAIELALASYPGFHTTAPPGGASPYGLYRAEHVPAGAVPHRVVLNDGTRLEIPPAPRRDAAAPVSPTTPAPRDDDPSGPVRVLPLGAAFGARSGDKGGDANVGVWGRSDEAYAWLERHLTPDRFRELIPEARPLAVERYELPNLRAVNFVVRGLLGDGVAASTRPDPQAKSLGELLRAQPVELPESILGPRRLSRHGRRVCA